MPVTSNTLSGAGAAHPASSPGGRRKRARSESLTAWMYLAPFLILFTLFTAVPTLFAVVSSVTDMSAGDLRTPWNVNFAGFSNFVDVLQNSGFQRALLNTLLFVVLCVPISIALGLGLALLLNSGIRRLKVFFRAAMYIPVITNVVAAAVIWQYAFSDVGPVNSVLGSLNLPQPSWLGESTWAVITVVMMGVWRTAGTVMVLYLAGLQAIPEEIYEAASTDGAGPLRRLWSITLPLLLPTTLLVVVLQTNLFLNIFDEPYVLTNGGPLGSTKSLAMWIYEQFGFGDVSASMVGSIFLLVIVAIIAVVQFRILRPRH